MRDDDTGHFAEMIFLSEDSTRASVCEGKEKRDGQVGLKLLIHLMKIRALIRRMNIGELTAPQACYANPKHSLLTMSNSGVREQ